MDKSKQYRIAMVLYGDLKYDDRVRKEVLTIQRLYPNISFKLFVMYPDNRDVGGLTEYGVPYKSIHSKVREKYPSNTHLAEKAFDFFKIVKKEVKGYDAIWCADPETALIAAFIKTKSLLWDLHELPVALMNNFWGKFILRRIFRRCSVVAHANPQRIDYLENIGCLKNRSKHYAIRNYSQFEDDTIYDEKYSDFLAWKQNRKCIYLQGLTGPDRADYESISAVLSFRDLVAVVVGRFDTNTKERLRQKYSDKVLNERVFFVGAISQMSIPQYIKQCYSTLIFYKNVSPNNYLCEANRLYQSVTLGLPVVVGNNPSMRELVEMYNFGTVAQTDGNDQEAIALALKKVIENRMSYMKSIENNKHFIKWEQQDDLFKQVVNMLLKNQ